VRRFIYVSSLKAVAEESAQPQPPAHDTRPQDRYGQAKRDAELALAAEAAKSGLEVVILRPPLVYGPGVKGNFLALMRAVASGCPLPLASISNRRSFIYVDNLCDAIARCLEAPKAAGRTYHLSDGAPLSTPQLCRALGEALDRRARVFRFPPGLLDLVPAMRKLTRSLETDDSAIRDELGWRPPATFEEGLQATARWYRAR
jgi:UDP-glucose 4-epimerase